MATITSSGPQAASRLGERLRDDDLRWDRDEDSLILVAPATPRDADPDRLRTFMPCELGLMVIAPPTPDGFREFVSAASLLRELTAVVGPDAGTVSARHADALRPLLDAGEQRTDALDPQRIGDSVTFAVTRRVSRESHHYAGVIDAYGQAVAEIAALSPGGLAVVVPDLDRWDRPSIRALYRAALFMATSRSARGAIVAASATDVGAVGRELRDAADARLEFLGSLAGRPGVRLHRDGPVTHQPPKWRLEPGRWERERIFAEIGRALAYQNYERVYLLCDAGLRLARDDNARADLHRLVSIAHAQRGAIASAQRELAYALQLASRPDVRAHLWYLRGLLHTKRDYNLEEASAAYAQGLAAIEDADGGTPTIALERAWLSNGQALVEALRARNTSDSAAATVHLARAFELELLACRLAKGITSSAGSYLRHNLLANLTFLLEISGRHSQAITFWTRSFDRYLAAESPSFQAVFDYRLAVLLGRVGRYGEARQRLASVRRFCAAQRDPFYEHNVCLAMAFFAGREGAHEEAAELYRAAAELSSRVRNRDGYCQALSGMLLSLADAGDREGLAAAHARLHDDPPAAALAAALPVGEPVELEHPSAFLRQHGLAPPAPAPKLSPYLPGIDLEGTPSRDLNRFLVEGTKS